MVENALIHTKPQRTDCYVIVFLVRLSLIIRVRIDGGVGGGLNPPTSPSQTYYFSKNID